ncbi:MAG: neutral zinc metallopeptidase [Pseudomonadota bacterium]
MVQWRGRRRSSNVEDGRGSSPRPRMRGMGGGGMRLKGGMGTLVLVAVVYFVSGGDLGQVASVLLGGGGGGPSLSSRPPAEHIRPVGEDDGAQFVSVILADTEDTWGTLFRQANARYPEPKLRLFSQAVNSACGYNTAAVGPFYCPPDQRIYLDLEFFGQLRQLGAPGDFAQAYVIGHEVGHHVQNVTGVLQAVQQQKRGQSQAAANALQVLVELQADCYAGVWAHHAETERDLLERGDVQEGLDAAAAIGDDALQSRAGRAVRPESFTHGSSAQRVGWFKRGFNSGMVRDCDTFAEAGVRLAGVNAQRRSAPARLSNNEIHAAFAQRRSDVQVKGEGVVIKVLPDDNEGSRHQKFILQLDQDRSLLVAHNIDLAQRLPGLSRGDRVRFYGEYEWNDRGGVLHWTHHDPAGRHPDGWLEYNGRRYE